jgi:hypothetical protein
VACSAVEKYHRDQEIVQSVNRDRNVLVKSITLTGECQASLQDETEAAEDWEKENAGD